MLSTASTDWGPRIASQGAGREEFGSVGMPCNVEGSAMTLLPNASACVIEELKDPASSVLEPLKENFEGEEEEEDEPSNSEDEGLNMKEIQMVVNIETGKV